MNILILTDYYHPIVRSGSIVIGGLAEELKKQGHKITILTFTSDQNDSVTQSEESGIDIFRIKVPLRNLGMIGRLYAEYRYSSLIIKALKRNQDLSLDSVICLSPSIFYGKAIDWIKKEYSIKTYLVCRDIFPKWAVDSGLLRKGLLYYYFKHIEKRLYRSTNFIGIESASDLEYFLQNIDEEKVEVLDNWGPPLKITHNVSDKGVLDRSKVNILYGGNMADAQDLLTLINLVDDSILEGKASISLIGSGHQLEEIKKAIIERKLKNIFILPEVDQETYLSILSEADIGLVSLNRKLESNNYPLKMMGYLQLSKPILASVNKNNEIISLIKKYDVGLTSISGEKDSFNQNLSKLINDEKLRKIQGKNALELFKDRFTIESAVNKILVRLKET